MKSLFGRFIDDERGATAIEYVLIASLVSVTVIAGASSFGSALNTIFQDISANF
jgi:pilus assembly protein Flp/PilA